MTHSGRSRWQSIFALALVAAAGFAARPVVAQNFRALQPQVPLAAARAMAGRVATILRDANNPGPEEIKVLDDFFMKNMFPSMTAFQPPEDLGELSATREQLFTRYINTAKSQGARDHLTSNTLKAMGAIAKGGYHPAVRYNAALIVGQLDQTPGKPLPAATEALVSLLENDEFNKIPAPTALKVAAIVGLQRHLAAGVDPAMAERITKAATAVALREEAPEDATPQVYGWVRKQAAKLLTAQFAQGVTPPVHQTFVTVVSDKSIDLDDRCGVAQLLKPEMYAKAEGVDFDAMAVALGELAKQVLTLEAKDATKYMDEMLTGGGFAAGGQGGGYAMGRGEMGMGRGGFGGMETMPEETGPTYERRRMIDRTLAIAAGATAVAAGGSDELKAKLGELAAALRAVAEPAAADDAINEEIAPNVENLSVDVNKLVATWIPAAAEDEPADEEFPVDAPAADEADADAAAEEAPAEPKTEEPAAKEKPAEAPAPAAPAAAG